jgi:UDP-N-acetylglucosamine/UDP-N-acetylgalactosamine diphosphorylase
MNDIEKAKEILNQYNQCHVASLFDKIDKAKQEELAKQVLNIDFHKIVELYDNTKKEIEIKDKEIKPIEYLDKEKMSKEEKDGNNRYCKYTRRLFPRPLLTNLYFLKGQYAVVTMAGGQGTRLGHTGPKGTFKLDVYGKGKYLFEILAENLKEANKTYMVTIPWYIMTSRENNKMTRDFLEKNNYFGYDKNAVTIFIQGELPLVDVNGKFLISKEMKIKEASDGNGGTYASLRSSGALANMKERGIKWVFIGSVDNALLKMVDTTLLGMAIDKGYEIASKSVVKANPKERVGVFCKMNNHPKVIEYTELPEKMAEEIDQNGELKYGESHIMCNLFTIDAIEKISKEPLMYHSAFKKNSYIDENGKEVIPEEPNSYKFESFIFDAFEFFDDIAIMRGKREDDFAPVKNKEGADSPKTAKELYEKYWEKHGKK